MQSRTAQTILLPVTPDRRLKRRAKQQRRRLRDDRVRPVDEHRVMIAFRPDFTRHRTAEILSRAKAVQHMREIEFRPPAELAPRALVDIDAIDPGEESPAARRKELCAIRVQLTHDTGRVVRKRRKMALLEWTRGGDDVAAETDLRRPL